MIKAILQKDVTNLGREGDLVRVRPGYFRNYLLPHGMATIASPSALKELEFKRKRIEAIRAEKKSEAQELAARLNQVALEIRHRCGEKGQLFGSVTSNDVVQALLGENFEVDRRKVVIHEPIKHIGDFKVSIRVYPEVTASIKVTVKPEVDQEQEIMERLRRAEEERKAAEEAAKKRAEEQAQAEAEAAAEGTEGEESPADQDGDA